MKKLILKIVILLALPAVALADVSVSSDSSRKIDNSQTNTIKKDKSLSVDKSMGKRDSKSLSSENAVEGSDSAGHTSRTTQGHERSNSSAVDVNINGLLLREFRQRYESRMPDDSMPKSQLVFASCRPLSGIIPDYPTLNDCPSVNGNGRNGNYSGNFPGPDFNNIAPRNRATHFMDCGLTGTDGGSSKASLGKDYQDPQKNPLNPRNEYVSKYARCRIVASKWIAEAAERAASTPAHSEAEVRQLVQHAYQQMDNDPSIFARFAEESRAIWSRANCSPTLGIYRDFQKPEIFCGVLQIDGNAIEVDGRATLSESSIEGRSYKIAISNAENNGSNSEDSVASDTKTSHAQRTSQSTDDYSEGKKTATLSKSKSVDDAETNDVNRSSGSSMSASPEK